MEKSDKKYIVIISDKASEMLVTHARYLANVSEEAAENFIDEFTALANYLEILPERNPWLSDPVIPVKKYRKIPFGKSYLMIYQIKKNKVYVDYIIDCRQDYKWLLS